MRPWRDELQRHRERGAAGGFGENALGAREQLDRVDDLGIARHVAPSARLAHRAQDVVAVGGISDRDRLGDRVGLDRRYQVGALVQRMDDRRGAGRLRGMNLEVAAR